MIALVIWQRAATAAVITLETGLQTTWDRQATPAASPSLTLRFANGDATSAVLYGFSLGLRFVPTAGATGTLTVATAVNPLVQPVFSSIKTPQVNPFPDFGYTSLSIVNATFQDTTLTSTNANAVTFALASTNALGTFDIVVDGDPGLSNWVDTEGGEFAFGNANGTSLTIGKMVVMVPEPSTAALVALGATLLVWERVREWKSARRARPQEPQSA